MNTRITKTLLGACAATLVVAGIAGIPQAVQAQDPYPSRPVRIIVPYAAGGANDTIGRLMAKELSERLKQAFVVENRPGAGQVIGTELVARSEPNGETILMGGIVHAINPGLVGKLPYDSVKDFTTVSVFAEAPIVCVVPATLGINDLKSFIEAVKKNPKNFTFASSGNGAPGHLAVESIMAAAKISMVHVPYKGTAQPVTDMLAGLVQLYCPSPSGVLPYLRNGKFKALAVTTAKRDPALPDVPTLAEAGLKANTVGTWYAFLVPSATDRRIVDILHKTTSDITKDPAVATAFANIGVTVQSHTQAESEKFVRDETTKWTRFVKDLNIKIQ
ncbi:Bug family tripartite tricarboxylate transporter substrate binding protein [Hydrogenophaga sp. BPS33]|uniref:Bug family tripartite tricarboxylate transporter substrate binding protein n=1 Tax=Hydrogenophaga sp. BPS33 TaxID=2651974 RepID=UPI001320230F|nr:tripartite tricarboxylate transporter substrate binding protein [Hydrogenophaga sp. BPS33]QHE87553.1 tripartite tricarboxylate transporter substrate binding protein [Hydrogenophaga sp. BPS33]